MKTSFSVDNQNNKSFFNLVLRCHADNRGFGKVVCPCIDGLFFPFFFWIWVQLLALLQPGLNTLCVRANAMAGVVQPSCHSCHKLYFPFTHVDVFLTTSAILHFFYRIPIKNLIHLLSNHSQLPSSPPTKLPLLPLSSPWRGCSRTPFGRRSWCNGVVEINYLFKVITKFWSKSQ